jgi:hypothetical protein
MQTPSRSANRALRGFMLLGLITLIAGSIGLLFGTGPVQVNRANAADVNRQLFLPILFNGEGEGQPELEDSELSYAIELGPAKKVAPGAILRVTITAYNNGPETLRFQNLKLRYPVRTLSYESLEGDRILIGGQSGDFTTVTFRRINAGETVSAAVLFRVGESLSDGTVITIEPEYFCDGAICVSNSAQVQVSSGGADTESNDETQELLVAPTSGDLDTVFRFSSRKFATRDTIQLWLGDDTGVIRRLPQEYRVTSDGWVRFELKGSEFGVGDWNLLAHGSLSGYTSIARFSVSGGGNPAAQQLAPLALPAMVPALDPALAAASDSDSLLQAEAQGGIAGRVTDNATGTGVPDVLIVVLKDGEPIKSTLTISDGTYLFPVGFETGTYDVQALPASAGGATSYQDAGDEGVSVTSPDLTTGVDFALLRGGTVAGRVTASDTRIGLHGVAVEVLTTGDEVVAAGITATDGSYTVRGLPEGTYNVRFSTATGGDGDVAAYDGTTESDVAVTAGATVFVDTALDLQTTIAKIRGRVSGPSGGLDGVFVAVFDGNGVLVDLTLSRSDGSYATGALADGSYRVAFITFFSSDSLTRRHVGEFYMDSTTFTGAAAVTISGSGVTDNINATLALGGTITGTVSGNEGVNLEDVLVAAYDADDNVQSVARTAADGTYELVGLPAGDYRVGFFAKYADDANVRRHQDSFYNGKGSLGSADAVTVTANSTTANIDATLILGGSISGQVTAADSGNGLPGVVVIAFSETDDIGAVAYTDATGAYEVSGLPVGAYDIWFDTLFAPVEATRAYIDEFYDPGRLQSRL